MSDRRPRTPPDIRRSLAREADRAGLRIYLVGGAVRDSLRRRRIRDLDIAVEGDAAAFARGWARASGGKVVSSSEFGTAAVEPAASGAAGRVDFAGTRRESYRSPAALPSVRPSSLEEDLARRDFTVNAMAIPLNGPDRGKLIDPFGGRADLSGRVLRMLHPASPQDDPTRAFRAVRFAMRLGFRIDPETRRWISRAVDSGAFDALSGDRLRREVLLLFAEQPAAASVRAMAALGLPRTLSPGFLSLAATRRRLERLDALALRHARKAALRRGPRPGTADPVAWASLLSWSLDLPEGDRAAAADRLGLAGERRREFLALALRARDSRAAAKGKKISALAALCRGWTPETVLAVASALDPVGASRLLRARSLSSSVRLRITGADLARAGVGPGPAIGRALEQTWRARIDRRIVPGQELPYALAEARK